MIMFVWGASVYFKLYRPPDDALEIYGTGKQWMWKFQHPEGHREINELHVPVGRPIKMTLTSQDVIHDFFVPVFRTKVDVIPGRYTTVWFQATKPGRYHLFCAEYCGTQHSGMIGQVIVMEPAQYQAWLSGSTGLPVSLEGGSTGGQGSTSSVTSGNVTTHGTTTFVAASGAGNSLASEGEKVFQGAGCIVCHKIGARGRGPDLAGLFGKSVQLQSGETVTADENYLRESIVNPQVKVVTGFPPIMAPYEGRLSEEEIIQLIAYIKSLK
jgi:cytochrome c oxidase subunit 2